MLTTSWNTPLSLIGLCTVLYWLGLLYYDGERRKVLLLLLFELQTHASSSLVEKVPDYSLCISDNILPRYSELFEGPTKFCTCWNKEGESDTGSFALVDTQLQHAVSRTSVQNPYSNGLVDCRE